MKNYKITYKLDNTTYVVYDSLSEDADVKVLGATLSLEENNAGSLSFNLPQTHPVKNIISIFKGMIMVYENSSCIWAGRPISKEEDFYGQVSVECEGALAFLNDTFQESVVYHNYTLASFITALLTVHNSKVSNGRKISVGTITVTDGTKDRYSEYEQTLSAINDIVTDTAGHIQIRYFPDGAHIYLDYLNSYNAVNSQYINFGENLLDYTKSYGAENFATVIFPLGKEDENGNRLTVESVNQGSKYVQNASMVAQYGWIESKLDDSSIETAAVLLSNAQKALAASIVMNSEINISAIDLSVLDNNITEIKLLDQVRVISKHNGIDITLPVKAISKDLCNPANDTFSLGRSASESLSTRVNDASDNLKKTIENLPTEVEILKQAKDEATALITSATTGYVTTRPNEILIADNANYLQATKIWRWNLNGLGYSSTGYNGTFGTAITMNGAIVADYITTGTMSAARISGGSLTSLNGNTSWNLNDGTFTMKKGSIEIGSKFKVDTSGNLTCSSVNITGGSISIGSKFSVDTSGNVSASSLSITGGSISIGSSFSVDSSGNLSCNNANVSGKLSAYTTANQPYSYTATDGTTYIGNSRPATVSEAQLKSAATMKMLSNIPVYPGTQWANILASGFSVTNKSSDEHDGIFAIQSNGIAVDHNYDGNYSVAKGSVSFSFYDTSAERTVSLLFINGIMVSQF